MNLAIMSTLLRLSTALAFVLAANLAVVPATQAAQAGHKPRLLVLTDIENGPDDAMSMVRFLVYANHYDIEGLAATTSTHQCARVAPQRIRQIVAACGKVRATRMAAAVDRFVAKLRVYAMMEGDTPSFLNLVDNGLSDPEHPDWGGWGGRYELYTSRKERWFEQPETRPTWTNAQDEVLGVDGKWDTTNHATIWRWRSAMQNDFAARMVLGPGPQHGAAHGKPDAAAVAPRCQVGHGPARQSILRRMARLAPQDHMPGLYKASQDIVLLGARRSPSASLLYLEVSEPGNPRQSFDINLYKTGLDVAAVAAPLQQAARCLVVPPEQLDSQLQRLGPCRLGHLSSGLDRHGQPFLTVYAEIH
jgi:hypothetical protein